MDWIPGLRALQMGCSNLPGWGARHAETLLRQRVSFLTVVLLLSSFSSLCAASHCETAGGCIDLSQGWRVLQDVHDTGERLGIFRPDWNPFAIGPAMSDWEPIPRLAHLQLLLAPQPYFGRELRYFNEAPWWYRLEFATPAQARQATLRLEGVDYFAKVFLNGQLLGEHEGYAEPFEFEVGPLLSRDRPNVLVVKVWSPWDHEVAAGDAANWAFGVVRRLLKGTYEHADTFVQRDVNPVGIWRPVRLILHDGLRSAGEPVIDTRIAGSGESADVLAAWPVALDEGQRRLDLSVRIRLAPDGTEVARTSKAVELKAGQSTIEAEMPVANPRLWSTWDHGGPALYQADMELREGKDVILTRSMPFGIRRVELRRTASETTFYLNGKRIYLRGTTYWPDVYVSAMDVGRYQRDLSAMIRAGMNAIRVHVHSENPEFYEMCDRLGLVVLQDFDLNWTFPTDEEFTSKAVTGFGRMIQRLRNHPSIICWIAMNEVPGAALVRPGPQLLAEAKRLDPSRPVIKNSSGRDDLESGDGHDYRGSLGGGEYLSIYGSKEKLATEFGVDAPPAPDSARLVPRMAERLREVLPRAAELHDYQYSVLKYYIEHYRMQKYAPNAGYFMFMWIDFCPQSFYGVYDYWGVPKALGMGGGLRALEESNRPVGIFMEYKNAPLALHAVNDSDQDLGECRAEWTVTKGQGERVTGGQQTVHLGPDSHLRVADLAFEVHPDARYQVALVLRGSDGRVLARNLYQDPFHPPAHPQGHPDRMDHEIGMRLWWAGESNSTR
jgi:beta-mannosidase